MKTSYILPIFIGSLWVVLFFAEVISREAMDVEGRAKLNGAVRQVIVAIQQNARYKFEQAKDLTSDPLGMMTQEELFVLTEKFDFDTASLKQIREYYRKLSIVRKGNMPPLVDKTVSVSPLRR